MPQADLQQRHPDGKLVIRHQEDVIDYLIKEDKFDIEAAIAVYLFEKSYRSSIKRRESGDRRVYSAEEKQTALYNSYSVDDLDDIKTTAKKLHISHMKEHAEGKWYIWTSRGAFQGLLGNALSFAAIILIGVLGKIAVDPNSADTVTQMAVDYINRCILFRESLSNLETKRKINQDLLREGWINTLVERPPHQKSVDFP